MKSLLYSWPSIFLVLVITFFLAKGASGVMVKERQSAGRVETLESEAAKLEGREAELKNSIERLSTDEGIMEEIRQKFSVTKEGEYVAIIVDERARATSTDELKTWYQKLWSAIIKNQ